MAVAYYLEPVEEVWYNRRWKDVADYCLVDYLPAHTPLPESYIPIQKIEFFGSIQLCQHYKGRSASGVIVLVEGHPFGKPFLASMSSLTLFTLLQQETMVRGVAKGQFTFAKKGANCFIEYVKREEDSDAN